MSDTTIFEQIVTHQDELNRELDECSRRGAEARARANTEALCIERAKYCDLRAQAKAHGELYDCVLDLYRWVSDCNAWRCRPTHGEIRNEVHELAWFYATELDHEEIELLVDGTIEAFEQ